MTGYITDAEWTAEDLENAGDVLTSAEIGYWANAVWNDDGLLIVSERDEDGKHGTISAASLLEWLHTPGPLALIRELGDPYQRAAVVGLMARDWENVDWDAETGDVLVQAIVLGGIVYG